MQLENTRNDEVRVIFVADNTPAFDAGLHVGDVLTTIDGVDMEKVGGILGAKKLMRQKQGTTLSIDINRGGEQKHLSLTLRDLYN